MSLMGEMVSLCNLGISPEEERTEPEFAASILFSGPAAQNVLDAVTSRTVHLVSVQK